MSLIEIRQHVGSFERALDENPVAMWVLLLAAVLAVVIFGGILFDTLLQRRREREKIKAVERLVKHLKSLPGSKS